MRGLTIPLPPTAICERRVASLRRESTLCRSIGNMGERKKDSADIQFSRLLRKPRKRKVPEGDWVFPPANLSEADHSPPPASRQKGENDDNEKNEIGAQRSGSDFERRSDGGNERCLMLLFSLAFATAFVVHKSADKTANATPADPSESNALTITVDDVRETIETNSSGVRRIYCHAKHHNSRAKSLWLHLGYVCHKWRFSPHKRHGNN